MTPQIGLLLGLLAVFVILFSVDWFSPDVVGLGLLMTLVLTGLLPANRAFAGFGSDAVILLFGLLIMTAALWRTGVMDVAGRWILRWTGDSHERLLLIVMISSLAFSSFMSNTATTAFFMPVILGVANRTGIHASRFLMPLAFSAILASSVTLIATSTNIVVSGLMVQRNLAPIRMFELAPVGLPIALVGLAYMYWIGRRLIPPPRESDHELPDFGTRGYLSEVLVLPDSALIGKTLAESRFGEDLDLQVVRLVRDKTRILIPGPDTLLQGGDVLLVEGRSEQILKIKDTAGVSIKADAKLADPNWQTEDIRVVEAILLPRSPLIGRTLKGYRFRERYGFQVLGINRHGETLRRKISQVPLRMGDVMLLQGTVENFQAAQGDTAFRMLGALPDHRMNRAKAPLALGIFGGSLALASLGWVPFPVAVVLGAVLIFLTGCITPDEAYRDLEWKVIVLIGAMLGLGVAMEETGTARYLAARLVEWTGSVGPMGLLTGFFFLTVLLTQPMSNQAAAVVTVPIAIQTALQLHLNPRPFAMMVAVAASCSYLTPLEPACLMVYGPGHYRVRDFLKVGTPLTLLIYGLAMLIVPRMWPLHQELP